MQLQCFLQLTKKKHMLSLIRATGRTLSVWLHGGSEQTVENHARWSPPSSESSDCSDVVMKLSPPHSESSNNSSDVSLRRSWSKDVLFDFKVIHLSRKRKHELISGSSDSSDQSSKSSCTDLFPDMRLCEEMEGKQHLYKILLSGPHGIRDRLMSSNQDQPQSEAAPTSPGSSKTCDVLMKSDGSKGRADTDRKKVKSRSGRHRRRRVRDVARLPVSTHHHSTPRQTQPKVMHMFTYLPKVETNIL